MSSIASPEVTGVSSLRVLIEPRPNEPSIFVATCLETGYIATGVGYAEAKSNIIEVLRTEILYAQDNGRKLKTIRVSDTLEKKWESVTSGHPAETIQIFAAEPEKKRPGKVTNTVAVARAVR